MTTYYLRSTTCGIWAVNHAYSLGDRVVCTRAYGTAAAKLFVYECTIAGTSHAATQPTWPTTAGNTVADNTATWTCRAPTSWANAGYFLDYFTHGITWVAGDAIYVSQAHSMAYGSVGDLVWGQNPSMGPDIVVPILCVNDGTGAITTGASIAISANGNNYMGDGYFYWVGITIVVPYSMLLYAYMGHEWSMTFENCTFDLGTSCIGIQPGYGEPYNSIARFMNCTFHTNSALAQVFDPTFCARVIVEGGSITGTAPTALMNPAGTTNYGAEWIFRGVDLSILGTHPLLQVDAIQGFKRFVFEDCKFGTSYVTTAGTWAGRSGAELEVRNSDSGDTNYKYSIETYDGKVEVDTAIYRTGGAATQGAIPFSWKMTTRATTGANISFPLRTPEASVRLASSAGASKTLTVEVIHDSATALTDAQVWVETMYLGTSGNPLGVWSKDRGTNVLIPDVTPAAQTASAAAWTNAMSAPNTQKLETTLATYHDGFVLWRVALALQNKIVYVCPKGAIA